MASGGLIEPESFDVIVLGTGLQEAMLAASAAASHLSVLHLDPNDFYGAHWASFDFKQLSSWAAEGGCFAVPASPPPAENAPESSSVDDVAHEVDGDAGDSATGFAGGNSENDLNGSAIDAASDDLDVDNSCRSVAESTENGASPAEEPPGLKTEDALADRGELGLEEIELEFEKSLFSGLKVCEYEEGASLGPSRSYSIDLCGPRLTFCGSNLVNMLLRSGASHYVEFKGIDASFIWTGTGMSPVPSSRADVFKDRSLSLPDKRYLMRFFKLVTDYATAENQSSVDISVEDLDGPFLDFLQRQRLPASIQSIIFYAIALVDEDQQREVEDSRDLLKTRDGLEKLAFYLSSVARFPNAPGAFIYPLYGQGELPQAFCRSAAVNGALYVLRRPVNALLVDKVSKEYRGVRTVQGQALFSKKLIMGPSVMLKSGCSSDLSLLARLDDQSPNSTLPASATTSLGENPGSQVARCVCITDRSISDGQSTLLVIFPPQSIHERGLNAIRALQLSSAASICPSDKYVVQLSTICTEAADGQKALEAAVQVLFASPESRDVQNTQFDSGVEVSNKPRLLWSVFYIQTLQTTADNLRIPGVAICKMPDGTLDGESVLTSTEEIFRELFPDKDFFSQAAAPEDGPEDETEDDDSESMNSDRSSSVG